MTTSFRTIPPGPLRVRVAAAFRGLEWETVRPHWWSRRRVTRLTETSERRLRMRVRHAAELMYPARPPRPAAHVPTVDERTGIAVWPGGARRVGPLLVIPGRTFDVDDPAQHAEAVQHANAVMAALHHHA